MVDGRWYGLRGELVLLVVRLFRWISAGTALWTGFFFLPHFSYVVVVWS